MVLSLPDIPLEQRKVYTVFAMGLAGGSPALSAVLVEDAGLTSVRVAHLSPDAPNVDVWVDGSLSFTDVAFGDITTYADLPAGSYLVQVEPAGAGGSGPFVISATLTLESDTDYTVAAINSLAAIEPLVLVDNNTIPAAGDSHVRFVHASPDAPAVDITLADGTVLFGDYEFGEFSPYLPVAATTYDLQVRLAGTSTIVLDLPGVTVENQTVYTVWASGYAAGTPALAPIISEDAGLSRLRVAHLSPDAPAVDILVDGQEVVSDLAFGSVTGYLSLPAGDYYVEVWPAGTRSGGAVLFGFLTLSPNTDYTAAATDELATIALLVLQDNNDTPAAGNAHVRFVHASPDAPAVDITLTDGTVLFGDYEFGEFSGYLPVAAGSYDLEVRLAGTSTVVLSLPGIVLNNQDVYTVYATGFAAGEPPLNALISVDLDTRHLYLPVVANQ